MDRRAPTRNRIRLFLAALHLVACVVACRTPMDPDGVAGRSVLRRPSESIVDSLHCRRGDCSDWHRIPLPRKGSLSVSVRIIEREDSDATISVLVADGFGAAIERLQDIGMEPGVLEIDLDEGIYLIGVSGRKGDRALRYELTPLFEAEPIASTPEIGADAVEAEPIAIPTPRYRRVDTEVLEIEGKLSSPTGVLLDIGSDRGVVAGMRGELFDDVDIVSEIEIVDVYDEGSRAVISLPMNRPITPSVRATLLFPADSEPGFESSDMMSPNDRPSPTD